MKNSFIIMINIRSIILNYIFNNCHLLVCFFLVMNPSIQPELSWSRTWLITLNKLIYKHKYTFVKFIWICFFECLGNVFSIAYDTLSFSYLSTWDFVFFLSVSAVSSTISSLLGLVLLLVPYLVWTPTLLFKSDMLRGQVHQNY